MNNTAYILAFGAGFVCGAAAAWLGLRNHYKQLADAEIRSVKETFSKRDETNESEDTNRYDGDEEITIPPGFLEYDQLIQNHAYFKKKQQEAPTIRIIGEEEYGDDETYPGYSLTYYADGILANDADDEIIDDPDKLVGDALTKFNGDEVVHVRNEEKHCDYEIVMDYRGYFEATGCVPDHGRAHDKEDDQ